MNTTNFSDLPEDLQRLISDFTDWEIKPGQKLIFPVVEIPVYRFPVVLCADGVNDARSLSYYMMVPFEEFPPVVLFGDIWLDGRHRVATARLKGIKSMRTIDITPLLQGERLAKMRGYHVAFNLGTLLP